MTLRGRFRAISVFKWGSRAGRKKTLSPVVLSLSSELPREDLAVTVVERHRMGVGGGAGNGGRCGNVGALPCLLLLCWLLGAGEKCMCQAAWESDSGFANRFLHQHGEAVDRLHNLFGLNS